jgi:2-(3-amino-3-carboxypropyl)histidine synthase
MKAIFIETRYKKNIRLPASMIKGLPKKIGLFSVVQFMSSFEGLKRQIESTGRYVKIFKTKHTRYPGQLLGCNVEKFHGTQGFVYIGDVPVYAYDPLSKRVKIITADDVLHNKKRELGAFAKFLRSDNIGVLVSLKPGQNRYHEARALVKQYPDKKFYYFVDNTLDYSDTENFPFIECYVNTACSRIAVENAIHFNKPIINLDKVI